MWPFWPERKCGGGRTGEVTKLAGRRSGGREWVRGTEGALLYVSISLGPETCADIYMYVHSDMYIINVILLSDGTGCGKPNHHKTLRAQYENNEKFIKFYVRTSTGWGGGSIR